MRSSSLRAMATAGGRRLLLLQQQQRSLSTGARGSRGHGWFHKYRRGLGGRHLQGRFWDRNSDFDQEWNRRVFEMGSQHAFLDISVDDQEPQRIVIELASAALPITCRNFELLCESGYESTKVHRIEKNVGLLCGDVLHQEGKGGRCHADIGQYGVFDMEHKVLTHVRGAVSMAAPGVDRVDSRFLMCTHDAPQLDGRFVAFGNVTPSSLDILDDWQANIFTKRGRPSVDMIIVKSGMLDDPKEEVVDYEEKQVSAAESA